VSRFQFVEDHRGAFGVKRLCLVLKVSRTGFYRWLSGADVRAGRQRADAELAERIGEIHRDSDGTYGVPRVTAELREAGVRVNHKRVARIMRTWGIVGLHLRKKVRTTIPDRSATPVPDLLRRDFTAAKPNTRYVGDITYLPVGNGQFLYLATVLDLCSKRLVGWSIADHMRTDLVTDALQAAAAARGGGGLVGAVFHSDNGAQGGFQGSSQHLDRGGVFYGVTRNGSVRGPSAAGCGSSGPLSDAVSGPATAAKTCRARVLGSDRSGRVERGRRCGGRRVDAGRVEVVPSRWRHVTDQLERAVGPLPVLR
jgi:hypothetical protein